MAHKHPVCWRSSLRLYIIVLWSLVASLALAQEYEIVDTDGTGEVILVERQNYQFTGALAIYGDTSGGNNDQWTSVSSGGSGSTAVQAQCPADHPVSCTNIQEPYYCCPANNYCAWSNSVVSCCPNGQTCSAGGGGQWQPSTTTYWTPAPSPTTVYAGGGYVAPAATTVYQEPAPTTHVQVGYGGYCSTLVAVGPGLPTTEAASCGTILIVEAEATLRQALTFTKLLVLVVALQIVGGVALLRR